MDRQDINIPRFSLTGESGICRVRLMLKGWPCSSFWFLLRAILAVGLLHLVVESWQGWNCRWTGRLCISTGM